MPLSEPSGAGETARYYGVKRPLRVGLRWDNLHSFQRRFAGHMMEDKRSLADLTIDEIRELWSRTYNPEGKPDWSHIFPYYHEDVVFKDSVQEIHGLEEFKALCSRLTKRCQQLTMRLPSVVKDENCVFMQWEMTMVFKKYPSSTVYGVTRLELHEDGRILSQRDYFDLWGDIFDNIPWFARPYRRFMRRKFG